MQGWKLALIVAAACGAGATQAQVYKCPDAGGRTVIQQVPCMGGEAMKVMPGSGHADPQAIQAASARAAKAKASSEIARGIATGRPVIGMTIAELQRAMGAPDKVNQANYGGVHKDQAIFYRADGTWYVYTTNGLVESMQFQEGYTRGAAASGVQCPSAHEIRSAEISASSMTNSPEQRSAMMRAVENMRACGRR